MNDIHYSTENEFVAKEISNIFNFLMYASWCEKFICIHDIRNFSKLQTSLTLGNVTNPK